MTHKKKIVKASFWVFLANGLNLVIRLGTSLIATRLLAPEVFGVVAIVYIVVFGVEMFSDAGLWSYVVRHKNPEDPHLLNAVWTMQVIRSCFVFLTILSIGLGLYLANHYLPGTLNGVYADSRLPGLLSVVSICAILNGLKSLASPVMSLRLDRARLELSEILSQFISAVFMITWLVFFPTIWALVFANVVTALSNLVFSYRFFPFRHRFVFDKEIAMDVFKYSRWIVLASALTYIYTQGDKLYLASLVAASTLGIYSIALNLSGVLSNITNNFVAKIAFPVFSKIANENRVALPEKYYRFRVWFDAAVFTGVGVLIYLAPKVVDILYDPRYSDAGWMLRILMVSIIGEVLSGVSLECLSAISVTKIRSWVMGARIFGLFFIPYAYHNFGFEGALWVVAFNAWLGLPLIYYTMVENALFSFWREFRMLPCILLGCGIGMGLESIIDFLQAHLKFLNG